MIRGFAYCTFHNIKKQKQKTLVGQRAGSVGKARQYKPDNPELM